MKKKIVRKYVYKLSLDSGDRFFSSMRKAKMIRAEIVQDKLLEEERLFGEVEAERLDELDQEIRIYREHVE